MCHVYSTKTKSAGCASIGRARLLVLVEGRSDINFLKSISAALPAATGIRWDLGRLEDEGRIVFVPFGGGNIATWRNRFAPLGLSEFHLYDGELPPETAVRQQMACTVNARAHCQAAVTSKRSIENYLHPQAILAAGGPEVCFGDQDNVAQLVAQAEHQSDYDTAWRMLTGRVQRALVQRAKRWLCHEAAARMTPDLLTRSDRDGEVTGWLAAIASLAAAD